MWQPFLKLLEGIGRIGFSLWSQDVAAFQVGDPNAPDSEGGADWRRYLSARRLWETWGPVAGSPWEPFHCVTLFAGMEEVLKDSVLTARIGPLADTDAPDYTKLSAEPPSWADSESLVIVDLPAPRTVTVGYYLAARAGFQPVCTFDNWPHGRGVMRSEQMLGALLYYAAAMDKVRQRLPVTAPPVWLCDRYRFKGVKPPPGGFDNRYIIEDRLLPGPQFLQRAGIQRIVYVSDDPTIVVAEDIDHYLGGLMLKGVRIAVYSPATAVTWTTPPQAYAPSVKAAGWSPASLLLMRSSAGGFGGFVPQPSSGG